MNFGLLRKGTKMFDIEFVPQSLAPVNIMANNGKSASEKESRAHFRFIL